MNRADYLGTDKIAKLLAKFAIPSVFSLVLHAVYNVVDRIFIGKGVGELGLAGVALSFPILLIIFGICLLFSSGGAALISLKLGEKKHAEAERVLGNLITMITLSGIVFTFIGVFFCEDLLLFFRASPETLPYAKEYMQMIFMGTLLFLYGFSMTFVIRAEGNPIYATMMMVVGSIVNVYLDYIFIFTLDMGIRGAALATVIAEAVVALMGVAYLLSRKGVLHIRRKNLPLNRDILTQIIILGLSPAIMNIVASIQLGAINSQLITYGGNQAIAAMGIVFSVGSIMMLFTFGMAAGMQPIIGYNYGARHYGRVQAAFSYVLVITVLVACVFVLSIYVFSVQLARLFVYNDPALVMLVSRALRFYLAFVPLASISILGARYFQSIGKGWHSVCIGITRQVFLFLPILFILSHLWQLNGIFLAGPATDAFAVIITAFMLRHERCSIRVLQDTYSPLRGGER